MVFSNLLIGSVEESFNHKILDAFGITHILNNASELNICSRIDRVYVKHGIPDDCDEGDIRSIMDSSIAFISNAQANCGVVMVHCLEGKSRSVCVVLAYMVCKLHWDFNTALSYIKTLRPLIDPFPIYIVQTKKYCHSYVGSQHHEKQTAIMPANPWGKS